MSKTLTLILIPFVLFAALVMLWITGVVLILAVTIVSEVLRNMYVFGTAGVLSAVATIFEDPWKVVALPIAISALVFFIFTYLGRSEPDDFVRGRRMGDARESRPRFGQPDVAARRSKSGRSSTTARVPFRRRP